MRQHSAKLSPLHFAGLLLLLQLVAGCSQTSLLSKQDYQQSQQHFLRGNPAPALLAFPRNAEQGTFITTLEQGYLSLIQGKPQIKELQRQAKLLENRVRYHVSREARNFFYVQTAEDYYASEHEVIWLHLLLSWGYSLQGQYSEACVEARVAGSLLSLPWSPAGHFDDPTLRLFLAGLWAMCGEWREAQVDLRAAWTLDNNLVWAKELAEHPQPPAHFFLVLGGPGPEPMWNPELKPNPLRAQRQVSFKLRGRNSPLIVTDQGGKKINAHLSPDALNWYARHLARETELHEIILDSAYGGKVALSSARAGTEIAVTSSAGLFVGLAGSALGGAIMHFAQSADAVKLGLIVAAASIEQGIKITRQGYQDSTGKLKQELDPAPDYRFVRYLPEYLWMGWSEQDIRYPVELRTPSTTIRIQQPDIVNQSAISVAHIPDGLPTCSYRLGDGSITVVPLPDAAGNCARDSLF